MTSQLSSCARLCRTALLVATCAVASVAFGAEPPADLPLRTGSSFDFWGTATRAIFIAVLCLALVAAALYAWRHRLRLQLAAPSAPTAAAEVEWARRASPRTTLLVVRWQGKRYLLAENGTTTQTVDSRLIEEPHQ